MSVPSLPLILLLLLPGFLCISTGFLVSRIRKLSAFEVTAWSLAVGLLLVVILYPAYAFLLPPPPHKAWPGLLQILDNPALVPGPLWVLLYVTALVLGYLGGWTDRKGILERVLRPVGIDLKRHGDVWGQLLRSRVYVYVHLTDGNVLYGWPENYSSDRSQPGPELYLTQVQIWRPDEDVWIELEHTRGIWLDASHISRIQLLDLPADNQDTDELS